MDNDNKKGCLKIEMEKDPYETFNIEKYIENKFELKNEFYEVPTEKYPFYKQDSFEDLIFNPIISHFHKSKDPTDQKNMLGLVMPIDDIIYIEDIENKEQWKEIAENFTNIAGVYIFYGANKVPIYVGETKDFFMRFWCHITGKTNTKSVRLATHYYSPCKYFKSVEFYKLHIDSENDRKVLERMLFYHKMPLHNWYTEGLKRPDETTPGRKYRDYLDINISISRNNPIKFSKSYRDKLRVHFGHISKERYCEIHGVKQLIKIKWNI